MVLVPLIPTRKFAAPQPQLLAFMKSYDFHSLTIFRLPLIQFQNSFEHSIVLFQLGH